jgi:protein SCO1
MFSTVNTFVSVWVMLLGVGHLLCAPNAAAAEPEVGIEQHLGEKIPLDSLEFKDENDKSISLETLFDVPVVLTLVYYRCPGACTPLLNELARVVQLSDYTAGTDYRLVTISFDPREGAELAKLKQTNMLKSMDKKSIPASSWRFLTGDAQNIKKLTEAVGFKYAPDMNGQDFIHATTLTFVGTDGMISRYLEGSQFTPADFEMAVVDATEGRARSFMKRIQRLCYSYQPENRSYVLQVHRIILAATLLFVGVFVVFLRKIKPKASAPAEETTNEKNAGKNPQEKSGKD